VLFGSTLTAADRAQLSPTNVHGSFEAILAALTSAVRTERLPLSRLRDAALAVATAAHDALCR